MVESESAERLQITNEKNEEDLIVTRRNYDNGNRREIGSAEVNLFSIFYIKWIYIDAKKH